MLIIQANNNPADALTIKTYLRILALATNPETVPITDLQRAAIQKHPDLPYYTTKELVEQAQGLLMQNPESGHLRFVHYSVKEYLLGLGDDQDPHRPSRDDSVDVN